MGRNGEQLANMRKFWEFLEWEIVNDNVVKQMMNIFGLVQIWVVVVHETFCLQNSGKVPAQFPVVQSLKHE